MTVRGAEERCQKPETEGVERRSGASPRVHFEAAVAAFDATGGGGFEAESVDVSADGMRLRTAYLPQVGERLVCRFDGGTNEVSLEGEVIWRTEEARGGEFGIRFFALDKAAEEALDRLCDASSGETADDKHDEHQTPADPPVGKGTRVRLHIEGLGSPMKARVRDAADRQLEVGSNLEFLRVGQSLELEDVDRGKRREARIDHVKVDIDPTTNVPQLVVSLRYDDGNVEQEDKRGRLSSPPARSKKSEAIDSGESPATSRDVDGVPSKVARAARSTRSEAAPVEAEEAMGESADDKQEANFPRGAFKTAADVGRNAAEKVGPVLRTAGLRAHGALSSMFALVQKRRTERAAAKKADRPRRMTAPPPAGALKSEGKRLVRDEGLEDETPPPPRVNKRAAFIGSALGLVVVLGVFLMTQKLGSKSATASKASESTPVAALPRGTADASGGAAPPMANVPLFGPTPLSTTEPVMAASPSASAAASAQADAPPSGDDDGDKKLVKEWGQGSVTHPTVLRIKMDGPIDGIQGASGAMGFTVSIPGRRSVSANTDLTRKDKRLASVKVVNTSQGAEVTIQFKDGVPAYLVRGKGDKLEIALGGDSAHKKVAKKKSKKKPSDE